MNDSIRPPVLPFLPPTDEPSSYALFLSVVLVGCLTVAICGNASQIVLQIYTRRLAAGFHQYCIALLLFINFLQSQNPSMPTSFQQQNDKEWVPLSLPSVILEKLVRIWMFGRLSCHSHHVLASAGRVLQPWIIAFAHAFISLILGRSSRLRRYEGMLASAGFSFLLILVLTVVIPHGMAAQLELIRKEEIDSEQYIMLIHSYKCALRVTTNPIARMLKFAFEFAVPLIITIYLYLGIRVYAKNKDIVQGISRYLTYITVTHFSSNSLYYIPENKRAQLISFLPPYVDPNDIPLLLPYISSAVLWIPVSHLSASIAIYHADKLEEERPKLRTVPLRIPFKNRDASDSATRTALTSGTDHTI